MTQKTKLLALMEATDFGGPAANLVATAYLLRNQVDTELVTFVRGGLETSPFIRRVREAGLTVHVIRERRRYDIAAVLRLAAIISDVKPDILQVHNTKSRLFLLLLCLGRKRDRKTARLDFFHGETWVDKKQHFYNRLDRLLFRLSPHVVAVSGHQRDLLISWGIREDKITVVHNAVTPVAVVPGADAGAGERTTVLAVGRLSAEKGHIILIRAFQRLAAHYPRLTLTIVGSGSEEDRLRRFITENRLQKRVTLAGHQQDPTPFYEKADLFVLPSLSEGLPNVLLEAAVHGIPVIAFAVGGVEEVLRDGKEARLLRDKSPEALAYAMEEFLGQTQRFRDMAARAKTRVLVEFGMEKRAQRLLDLYRSLVNVSPDARRDL